MPAFLWMEEGDFVERFSAGGHFVWGGRAEIGNSSVFFLLVPNKKGTLGASGSSAYFMAGFNELMNSALGIQTLSQVLELCLIAENYTPQTPQTPNQTPQTPPAPPQPPFKAIPQRLGPALRLRKSTAWAPRASARRAGSSSPRPARGERCGADKTGGVGFIGLWVKTQEIPGEHRWHMGVHPPQNGGIGYGHRRAGRTWGLIRIPFGPQMIMGILFSIWLGS